MPTIVEANKWSPYTTRFRYHFHINILSFYVSWLTQLPKVYETLQKMLQTKLEGIVGKEEEDRSQFEALTGKPPSTTYSSGSCSSSSSYHRSLALWHKLSQRNIILQSLLFVREALDTLLPKPSPGVLVQFLSTSVSFGWWLTLFLIAASRWLLVRKGSWYHSS